jgi:hypothetical protein
MNEIRTTITYNLPILRKYMIFVRIYNLFGFLAKYESSYFTGKTHHGGLHHWVSAQERYEVLNEGVLGIDAVEPIGNAAKLRIETVDGEIEISYPSLAHP